MTPMLTIISSATVNNLVSVLFISCSFVRS